MRAVIQRVSKASVTVDEKTIGAIGPGLLMLLGVGQGDAEADADYLADKVAGLRIFPDDEGKMNRSVVEIGGQVMVISQFTLFGDARRGKRPSFIDAAPPDEARRLYEYFVQRLARHEPHRRHRRVPGDDGRRPRQLRTGDDPARQQEEFLTGKRFSQPAVFAILRRLIIQLRANS